MWWKRWNSGGYSGGGDSGKGGFEDGGGTMGQRRSRTVVGTVGTVVGTVGQLGGTAAGTVG
eukprot:735830-Pyramimonas_sp.AAC.1